MLTQTLTLTLTPISVNYRMKNKAMQVGNKTMFEMVDVATTNHSHVDDGHAVATTTTPDSDSDNSSDDADDDNITDDHDNMDMRTNGHAVSTTTTPDPDSDHSSDDVDDDNIDMCSNSNGLNHTISDRSTTVNNSDAPQHNETICVDFDSTKTNCCCDIQWSCWDFVCV